MIAPRGKCLSIGKRGNNIRIEYTHARVKAGILCSISEISSRQILIIINDGEIDSRVLSSGFMKLSISHRIGHGVTCNMRVERGAGKGEGESKKGRERERGERVEQ